MDFWHYYKIETYSNKIVFNVTKADFTMLSEKISNFQPSASFFTYRCYFSLSFRQTWFKISFKFNN